MSSSMEGICCEKGAGSSWASEWIRSFGAFFRNTVAVGESGKGHWDGAEPAAGTAALRGAAALGLAIGSVKGFADGLADFGEEVEGVDGGGEFGEVLAFHE